MRPERRLREQDRASVVAGRDEPPILEAGKHVFDPVAQAVECGIVRNVDKAAFARWDSAGYWLRCTNGLRGFILRIQPDSWGG